MHQDCHLLNGLMNILAGSLISLVFSLVSSVFHQQTGVYAG